MLPFLTWSTEHAAVCLPRLLHPPGQVLVAQLCLTLCDPMDGSPPGSSVHEIFLARRLDWVATPYSRGSSRPSGGTHNSFVSCTAGRFFTAEPQGKPSAPLYKMLILLPTPSPCTLLHCLLFAHNTLCFFSSNSRLNSGSSNICTFNL